MIVIDFLVNISKAYYASENIHYLYTTFGVSYFIYFVVVSFMAGKDYTESEDKSEYFAELFTIYFLGGLASFLFALLAGLVPLVLSICATLYIVYIIMFKWGENYKKIQSYKKDETSEYVKEIARLEELVKQFEKSK